MSERSTDHEIMHAASAADLEPTLAHLRYLHSYGASDRGITATAALVEFDAIVAAARREVP